MHKVDGWMDAMVCPPVSSVCSSCSCPPPCIPSCQPRRWWKRGQQRSASAPHGLLLRCLGHLLRGGHGVLLHAALRGWWRRQAAPVPGAVPEGHHQALVRAFLPLLFCVPNNRISSLSKHTHTHTHICPRMLHTQVGRPRGAGRRPPLPPLPRSPARNAPVRQIFVWFGLVWCGVGWDTLCVCCLCVATGLFTSPAVPSHTHPANQPNRKGGYGRVALPDLRESGALRGPGGQQRGTGGRGARMMRLVPVCVGACVCRSQQRMRGVF